jgi:hypothetical protein
VQDEGALLEYPDLIAHGEVPFRDFQSSYGPDAYLPLVATFAVLTPSVNVERAVGVAYRLAVVLAIVRLMLPLGLSLALLSGVLAVAAIRIAPGPPIAYSWYGGLACSLWAIWLARRAWAGASAHRWMTSAGAGLCAGSAVSFRPELGAVGLVALIPLLIGGERGTKRSFIAGLLIGSLPFSLTVLSTGVAKFWSMWAVRFSAQSQGSVPLSPFSIVVLGILCGATLLVLVSAIAEWRRARSNAMTRGWLAFALLSVAVLPQAFQRADVWHFAFTAPLALGGVPWAVTRGRKRIWPVLIVIPAVLAMTIAYFVSLARSTTVVHAGRAFPVATSKARDITAILSYVDRHSSPGQRLFVGTADLRFTLFADTVLYYLLPDLKPAGFYLEFNVGDADRAGSGLTATIRRANVLILDSLGRDAQREFYPRAVAGSSEPNVVVRREFYMGARAGELSVWLKRPG